jgi:hypothetical protein
MCNAPGVASVPSTEPNPIGAMVEYDAAAPSVNGML